MDKVAKKHDVKYLTMPKYYVFRNTGIMGREADTTDGESRIRNSRRNSAFADSIVTTGMRLTEVASVSRFELPTIASDIKIKSIPMELGSMTAKGAKSRRIWWPKRVLRDIEQYIRVERQIAVKVGRDSDFGIKYPVRCSSTTANGITLFEKKRAVPWSRLTVEERNNCLMVDKLGTPLEPLSLWLTEKGHPCSVENWSSIFDRASLRVSNQIDVTVSPHTLRHTYAVEMLPLLIRKRFGSMDLGWLNENVYERISGDPLDILRRLLGHASITSTFIYLNCIEHAREIISDASSELAEAASLAVVSLDG